MGRGYMGSSISTSGVSDERDKDCIAGLSGERISGKRELDKTSYLFEYNSHPSYQSPIDQPVLFTSSSNILILVEKDR